MGWLGAGAGAAEGLEQLLTRHRAEELLSRQQAALEEQVRSAKAGEALESRGLDLRQQAIAADTAMAQEASRGRQQQQQTIETSRLRDDARGQLGLIPVGTLLSPTDQAMFLERGAAVPGMFREVTSQMGDDGSEPQATGYEFLGTAGQQHARTQEELARAQRERQQLNAERSQALATDRERRIASWGAPTIPVFDPNSPTGGQIIPRNQLPPGGAPVPATAGQRQQVLDSKSLVSQLDRLGEMFDTGAGKMVGPAEGRLRMLGQYLPGELGAQFSDETFNNFVALSASFLNRDIREITGAAMTEKEAIRIGNEVPKPTDRPEVWLAKFRQFRKTALDLQAQVATGKRAAYQPGGGTTARQAITGQDDQAGATHQAPQTRQRQSPLRSGRFIVDLE